MKPKDVQTSKEECQRSLIEKIHAAKVANFTSFRNTLSVMWSSVGSFKIRELGVNLYQFVFANQEDKQRILNGKAWAFDSQFLILKPLTKNIDFLNESFNRI